MRSLLLVIAVIGIPLLYSCVPNSETALEPQYPTVESPSLTDQVEDCLISLHKTAMDKLTSDPYFADDYYVAEYINAYARASEIIADDLKIETDFLLNVGVLHYKNDWDIKEISTNVYSVSGYGLGHSDGQLSYGEWYFYESPKIMEPRSSDSKELKDIITRDGEFAPYIPGLFPNGEQLYEQYPLLCLPVTEVPFIWESVLLAESYSLVVSKNVDLSEACIQIDTNNQCYIYDGELDHEDGYFWMVTGWGNYAASYETPAYYLAGQSPIYYFLTE